MLDRRALLAGAALLPLPALAQDGAFPSRPLRLVSPFNPGGAIDVLNRMLAERMTADLGQPVVVEARPGANTIVGAEIVAKAPPDGHVFMITTNSTHTNNPALYRELPYDAQRSFAPVTLLSMGTVLLLGPASAPYADARGFADWARAQARVTYGSWGVGSGGHLFGEKLRARHGLPLEHVPYRGEQPAILDMLAGRLDVTFCSPVGARPQIAAGTGRAVGMTGSRRSAAMPEVPTFAEQGFDGLDMPLFVAAWAPAGTPQAVVARLRESLVRAVAEPAVREQMLRQGQTPVLSTPEELAATVARDAPRWAELIRASGARVE
ncbi:MAG: tripartite tricarboxylate transporter substrate binding protein [Acetobacteraceae bacterium]|nr:tripartite tricarboxylate transporter substrate binding protein [Acetobacteraceae bacterium]